MAKELYELIHQYESNGDFTYADVTSEMLDEAECRLGVTLPEEYRYFLMNYGHGGIGGIEVLGVGKNGKLFFENYTLEYRSFGMPEELVIVENCDEWLYCINTRNNRIVEWSLGDAEYCDAYGSFEEYLQDQVNNVLENM